MSVLFKTVKEAVQGSQHLALLLCVTRNTGERITSAAPSRLRHCHLDGLKETKDRRRACGLPFGYHHHLEKQVTEKGQIYVLKENNVMGNSILALSKLFKFLRVFKGPIREKKYLKLVLRNPVQSFYTDFSSSKQYF